MQPNIVDEHRHKNPQKKKKNTSKPNSAIHLKRLYTMSKWDLSQGCKDFSVSTNQCDAPH